jgi:putative ABC transport system ATP-binding protein
VTSLAPSSTVLASATGLRKSYGSGQARVTALDGVDCDVRAGEFLVITGPSGSGKTTLLHCLSGIATPDSGQVHVDGIDLATLDDDARTDLRQARFGFCFQTLNLLPALTIAENVQLPLVMAGRHADEIRARTTEVLARVGLAGREGAFPADLSGGEQMRVAIARALVNDPEVVWADEPTGALDSAAAAVILTLFRVIVDRGGTVVVVSHDPDVVARADRVVRLRDGRLARK